MTDRRFIYIQNISNKTSSIDLNNAFSIFGDVLNVNIGEFHNSAIIEFSEENDAISAIENMNLSEIYGETIFVTFATKENMIDKSKAIWKK